MHLFSAGEREIVVVVLGDDDEVLREHCLMHAPVRRSEHAARAVRRRGDATNRRS
jgi:hypothetical protein